MGPPSKVQRKTLVERAGEITKQPAPNFRPGSAYANATSLNGVPRNTSFSSSVSSRPPSSASSRTFSNTSYSSSVGPGTRPASVNAYRSNSSSNHSRLQRAAHGRSATPLDPHHEETPGGQVLGKRKGRYPLSSQPSACGESIQQPRLRDGYVTLPSSRKQPRKAVSMRDISISTRLHTLSLDDNVPKTASIAEPHPPQTPSSSCIPRMVPPSPVKSTFSSPSKSPRKKKSQPVFPTYLNKETNVTSAWDIDQKWEEMEIFRDQVTENAKVGMEERKELKECLNVYKSLGMFHECEKR